MPSNAAAWLTTEKAKPLEVKAAPYIFPRENQIVINNGAVAIDPIDWSIQEMGSAPRPLSYPFVGRSDVASKVVEVGSGVTRFRIGDRVIGMALAMSQGQSGAAFQTYSHAQTNLASPVPGNLSYENAAVIPLGSVNRSGRSVPDRLPRAPTSLGTSKAKR